MSYILNALRKSEQERQASQSPALENSIQETTESKKPRWVFWLIAAVILGNALFLIVFSSSQQSHVPNGHLSSEKPKAKPIIPNADIKPKSKKTATATAPLLKPKDANAASTSKTERHPKSPSIAEILQAKKLEQTKKQRLHKPKKPAIELTRAVVPAPPQAPIAVIKPPPAINTNHKAAPNTTGIASTPEPPVKPAVRQYLQFKELPFEFRREVPNLNINVYVYAEEPAERFVLINMVKYKAGQKITPGMKLVEIQPESLLVKFKNKTFRIPRP